jgi:hypothetical protein
VVKLEVGNYVHVKGYEELGLGEINDISDDKEYPIFVIFLDKTLHESENSGCFPKEWIINNYITMEMNKWKN